MGARYAAAQLGVPESQSVREWMKRLPEMEDALEQAQAVGGESASRHTRNKKSMSRGRVRREEKERRREDANSTRHCCFVVYRNGLADPGCTTVVVGVVCCLVCSSRRAVLTSVSSCEFEFERLLDS